MQNLTSTEDRPTPLPTDPTWFKKFNAAVGDPDPKVQAELAKKMQLTYRCGGGELIWAMTTTQPDVAFASVKLSQANAAPDEHHYHGVKHALSKTYIVQETMVSIFGERALVQNSLKALFLRSTVISKTCSWMIDLNMTPPQSTPLQTLIGRHALK